MIDLSIDDRQIIRLATRIVLIKPPVTRAIRQGVQDAGNKTLTQVRRALKEQTGVSKYQSITKRTGGYSTADGGYAIRAFGPPIPIKEFPVSRASSGVVAYSWGTRHAFKRSFVSASGRMMARTTSAHSPVRALLGPNLAKELGEDLSRSAFYLTTRAVLVPSIVKRLGRVLG